MSGHLTAMRPAALGEYVALVAEALALAYGLSTGVSVEGLDLRVADDAADPHETAALLHKLGADLEDQAHTAERAAQLLTAAAVVLRNETERRRRHAAPSSPHEGPPSTAAGTGHERHLATPTTDGGRARVVLAGQDHHDDQDGHDDLTPIGPNQRERGGA